jgi:hypothetical protein
VTTLIDELRADQGKPNTCGFCHWLATRSEAERKEWASVATDRSFTCSSLFRAAKKRGYPHGTSAVETHRKNGHT